jgi:hypothetical protein
MSLQLVATFKKEAVLASVAIDGHELRHVQPSLKGDKEVVLVAVAQVSVS